MHRVLLDTPLRSPDSIPSFLNLSLLVLTSLSLCPSQPQRRLSSLALVSEQIRVPLSQII